MNFLIFRVFSRFFWNFPNLFLIFKEFKMIKKRGKKGVDFCAGPTWVRCGTEGHVAEPRRPTQAPAWRGGDT